MQTTFMILARIALHGFTGFLAVYSMVRGTRGEWPAAIYFILCAILVQVAILSAPNSDELAKANELKRQDKLKKHEAEERLRKG
jgi:hypothetical protein